MSPLGGALPLPHLLHWIQVCGVGIVLLIFRVPSFNMFNFVVTSCLGMWEACALVS